MCQNSESQRAPSRVDVWRRRGEGLTSHATLQWANCTEEDCSLEASSTKGAARYQGEGSPK